jgi:hypothetical protein
MSAAGANHDVPIRDGLAVDPPTSRDSVPAANIADFPQLALTLADIR